MIPNFWIFNLGQSATWLVLILGLVFLTPARSSQKIICDIGSLCPATLDSKSLLSAESSAEDLCRRTNPLKTNVYYPGTNSSYEIDYAYLVEVESPPNEKWYSSFKAGYANIGINVDEDPDRAASNIFLCAVSDRYRFATSTLIKIRGYVGYKWGHYCPTTNSNIFRRVKPNTTCEPPSTLIGFFNGVSNTKDAATASLNRLQIEFGLVHKSGPLKYKLFYNQTACGSGLLGLAPCIEDVAEVFAQRNKELGGVLGDRWEIFWELLAGAHEQSDSLTSRLLKALGNSSNALLQLLDSTFAAMLNQLTGSFTKLLNLLSTPPTVANTAAHVATLKEYADRDSGMVLVAHSQGNLFVNAAHDALKASNPNANVKVVHVAPASPTLRGDYGLAGIDIVINGLRLTGANSVPAANINMPPSKNDLSGHSFEPTYMDTTRAAYTRIKAMITTALDAL
jgi:hypothetical protein